MDRERRERERREERDRMEREQRREQERRERERKDQLSKVDEHFKLSMEYHNKVRPDWNYLWSSFINLLGFKSTHRHKIEHAFGIKIHLLHEIKVSNRNNKGYYVCICPSQFPSS